MPGTARAQTTAQLGRIIVGYPAGGSLDHTARRLADVWRQQSRVYIVDNRAGAAGRLAGFDQLGMDQITMSPREYVAWIAGERETWQPIVKASGFTSED